MRAIIEVSDCNQTHPKREKEEEKKQEGTEKRGEDWRRDRGVT